MTTRYANLVTEALNKRSNALGTRISLEEAIAKDAFSEIDIQSPLAIALDRVNQHISVNPDDIEEAKSDYDKIAAHLVQKLHWPNDSIRIIPQGSSKTQTLIRSPDASKFDIDAVCIVDISRIEAYDPMTFFEQIGKALSDWEPERKRRCWRLNNLDRAYYIEFTPSIPLDTISLESIRFTPNASYKDKALAVVDTPSEQWKTSNPEGFAEWVSDQSKCQLLEARWILKRAMEDALASDSVESVPDQNIPLNDTLRIAIRLLKRHRDMAADRGLIDKELKPISVVIVTLLTQCYQGLAELGKAYSSPISLLIDLVELMPYLVENRDGKYWIENPTVDGENFAERWNDNPKLKSTFATWQNLLITDLNKLSEINDDAELLEATLDIFGCKHANGDIGLAPRKPNQVKKPPATKGLA